MISSTCLWRYQFRELIVRGLKLYSIGVLEILRLILISIYIAWIFLLIRFRYPHRTCLISGTVALRLNSVADALCCDVTFLANLILFHRFSVCLFFAVINTLYHIFSGSGWFFIGQHEPVADVVVLWDLLYNSLANCLVGFFWIGNWVLPSELCGRVLQMHFL